MKNQSIKVCLIRKNKPTKEVSIPKRAIVVAGVGIVAGGLAVAGLNAYSASRTIIAFQYL